MKVRVTNSSSAARDRAVHRTNRDSPGLGTEVVFPRLGQHLIVCDGDTGALMLTTVACGSLCCCLSRRGVLLPATSAGACVLKAVMNQKGSSKPVSL